jgi:hypothetical protein
MLVHSVGRQQAEPYYHSVFVRRATFVHRGWPWLRPFANKQQWWRDYNMFNATLLYLGTTTRKLNKKEKRRSDAENGAFIAITIERDKEIEKQQ